MRSFWFRVLCAVCAGISTQRARRQGADRQIRASKPNILLEASDTHRPGAVALVRDFLEPLGYVGSVLRDRNLVPIDEFDPARDRGENFIFTPERVDLAEFLAAT
jgi:hypothetical protein